MRSLIILLIAGFCFSALAVENTPDVSTSDVSIEKVRKRIYPGGADEEDLKVLEQLPEAPIKVAPITVQKQVLGDVIDSTPEESPSDNE